MDNLTQIQGRLAQDLIHNHRGSSLNFCQREVCIQHVIVGPQRSSHVMMVSCSTKKRFSFISNCQLLGKKVRHAPQGEVGDQTQDLLIVSQAL